MASWIVHLRIAETLYPYFSELDYQAFCLGNVAIDSGVVKPDLSVEPSVTISHWTKSGLKHDCRYEDFYNTFYDEDLDLFAKSFYLGCVSHLMTDNYWVLDIFNEAKVKYEKEMREDKFFVLEIKKDWYDQDFLYLSKHPDFIPLKVLGEIHHFENNYLPWFSKEAIQIKIDEISHYYQNIPRDLKREYPYLNQARMDAFVKETTMRILKELQRLKKPNR